MQQEVQETSSLQQDLDEHTVAQEMQTTSVGSTLQNAMLQDMDQLKASQKIPDQINTCQGTMQQDEDQLTITQRLPATSAERTLHNAMQQDIDQLKAAQKIPDHVNTPQCTMQQGENQHTVTQRLPATSSPSTLQNALQESEEGMMIDTCEPVVQAKSDFQKSPQDL